MRVKKTRLGHICCTANTFICQEWTNRYVQTVTQKNSLSVIMAFRKENLCVGLSTWVQSETVVLEHMDHEAVDVF